MRADHPSEGTTNTTKTPAQRQHKMSQQPQHLRPYTEANVQLAISNLTRNQIQSIQRAQAIYKVPKTTILHRRDRTRARRDCEPNLKRLIKLEEEVVLDNILNASLYRVPPTKALVRDMADRLLRERGGKPVSKH
jgi:hypothetical protein